MATQYTQRAFGSVRSTTSSVSSSKRSSTVIPASIDVVVHAKVSPDLRIEKGLSVDNPFLMKTARVLSSFYVRIQQVHGEFLISSDVSDVYESGDTPRQATLNYLYSLVDELSWFQEHKENLSHSMLKDFERLQFYLSLV